MAKILVAGLDGTAVDTLTAELLGDEHDVLTTSDGYEALQLALAEQPDLIFLEPALTLFDGLETCAMLRKDPEIPRALPIILLVSEELDPRTRDKAGATTQFLKAHAAWELRELLSKYLAG